VADTLRVDPEHVFFVSGGTEANNLVVFGVGDPALPVVVSAAEHPSVLAAARQRGVVEWEVDAQARALVTPPPVPVGLLALAHGQNEVGTLQPVAEASALAKARGIALHVDASQTLGRCTLDTILGCADSITFSTHKAGGLRGCAVLVDRNPTTRPSLYGGAQQLARRPGTESASLIAATALALRLGVEEQDQRAASMFAARSGFLESLLLDSVHRLTPEDSLPNTVMLRIEGVDGRKLLPALDMAGVEASQGSACSSGSPTPPPVLAAIGLDEDAARSCVRFSFSHQTSREDAIAGARVVTSVVHSLRSQH